MTDSQPDARSPDPKSARTLLTGARALSAAAGVALIAILYARVATGGFPWMPENQADQVSDSAQLQRLQAFATLEPIRLQPVPDSKLQAAVQSMALPADARQALLQDVSAPGATTERLRLAWITLWDTDVQDGDIVRIDSRGYSKTVTLTKGGETFAVPVPADGILTVTGIKDGDGGGITVGLASGGVKAIFPVMSTGQSLGLRVTID